MTKGQRLEEHRRKKARNNFILARINQLRKITSDDECPLLFYETHFEVQPPTQLPRCRAALLPRSLPGRPTALLPHCPATPPSCAMMLGRWPFLWGVIVDYGSCDV
jgi:hypothetical protein